MARMRITQNDLLRRACTTCGRAADHGDVCSDCNDAAYRKARGQRHQARAILAGWAASLDLTGMRGRACAGRLVAP